MFRDICHFGIDIPLINYANCTEFDENFVTVMDCLPKISPILKFNIESIILHKTYTNDNL